MPAFPVYEQRTSVRTNGQSYAPAPVQVSDAVAQSLGAVGRGVEQIGHSMAIEEREKAQALKKQEDDDARAWSGNATSNFTLRMQESFAEQTSKAQGAAAGFVPQFMGDFDTAAKDVLAQAPNEASKKYLTAQMTALRTQMGGQAVAFEAGARQGWRVKQTEDAIEAATRIAAADPSQAAAQIQNIRQTIPDVGPAMREKLADKVKAIAFAAAGTEVLRNPEGTLRTLNHALNIPEPPRASPAAIAQEVTNSPPQVQTLIAAIYGQESNYGQADTSQPNYGGARGPMQVTEPTFNGLKEKGLISKDARWDNPDDTMKAGVALINHLWAKYDGNPRKVAAAYYAGEKAVNADGTITDFKDLKNPKAPTTLQYVDQVVARMGAGNSEPQPLLPLQAVEISADTKAIPTGVGWVDSLTPAEMLHYRQAAYTEMQRGAATARQGLEQTERDIQAEALQGIVRTSGIPTQEQYITAFGPVLGPMRYRDQITNTIGLGRAVGALQVASPSERVAILAANKPTTAGQGSAEASMRYRNLVQAAAIVDKALEDDPGAYVARNSPRVREAQAAAAAAGPDQQAAAADAYATASLAEQRRLGALRPRLLTEDQASKIVAQFQDQGEGSASAADLMDRLQRQWGRHFPVVYQQLQKDDKLPVEAMVIPNVRDAQGKVALAAVAKIKDEELRKMLAAGDAKVVQDKVLTTMADFQATTAVQGGGLRTYAAVQRATERLAMYYTAGGKKPVDAVALAYEQTVGHAYQFEGSYRVPKGEMPAQIVQGVTALKYRIAELPVVPPPAAGGMRQEDADKQFLDALRAGATFTTNSDESGLLLYVQAATGLVPVRGPDGRQIGFSWKQLRDEAERGQDRPFIGYARP